MHRHVDARIASLLAAYVLGLGGPHTPARICRLFVKVNAVQVRALLPAIAVLAAIGIYPIGCESQSGKSVGPPEGEKLAQANEAEIYPTNTGGNGNTATTSGSGATNGVSGNETPGADATMTSAGNSSGGQ